MSGGLYNLHKSNVDTVLNLDAIKPYGDTMNDGKIQLSFTLPVANNDKGQEAAKILCKLKDSSPSEIIKIATDKIEYEAKKISSKGYTMDSEYRLLKDLIPSFAPNT